MENTQKLKKKKRPKTDAPIGDGRHYHDDDGRRHSMGCQRAERYAMPARARHGQL